MNAPVLELEGTWEEVAAHAPELAGRRVRLTILPMEKTNQANRAPAAGFSTAGSLLKFAGTWEGDDLRECLEMVYHARGLAEFKPSIFDKDKD